MNKKSLLTIGIAFLLCISHNAKSQTMPLYLNFNSHNEISDNISYSTPTVWSQYRGIVLAIADTFYQNGVKWNLQAESDFIRADISNENGYTNPNDLLDSLDNSATVEVDPHNHFDNNSSSMSYNPYNYPDVAHLLDSAGLAYPRYNMGGFLYTSATDFMPYQNPVAGNTYNTTWNPNVIWGAGSPGHTNDYNGYGVWKPQGANAQFMNHFPSNHLTFIGNGCSMVIFDTTHVSTIVNGIVQMLQYIQYQTYDPMAMYTASIQMNFNCFANPGYVDTVAAIVRGLQQYVNSGKIIYQTLTEKYTTWYGAHTLATDHFRLDCAGLPLGVSSNSESNSVASLYPNPTSSILNIELPDSPIEEIQIIDMQGKCVMKKSLDGISTVYQLDVSELAPGLYFAVEESSSGQRFTSRFLKE